MGIAGHLGSWKPKNQALADLGAPHHTHMEADSLGLEGRAGVLVLCKLIISLFVIRFAWLVKLTLLWT